MTLTTSRPPRRISNRTKKRCRNIKNFFCKALNTKSETNNKNQPSLSISDLKEKISSLETQLEQISKHCYSSTKVNDSSNKPVEQTLTESKVTSGRTSHRHSNSNETKLLYKATSSKYENTDGSDNASRRKLKNNNIIMIDNESESNLKKSKKHKGHESWQQQVNEFHAYKKSVARHLENIKNERTCKDERKRRNTKNEYQQGTKKEKKYKQSLRTEIPKQFQPSSNCDKSKRNGTVVDQDFISNIIKSQYRPIKLFDAQHCSTSQFSAPVCRDKEYSMRNKICYDYDLCSCCFDQPRKHDYKKIVNSNVREMKSVCDARLYSTKKKCRRSHSKGLDDYNNADFYDLTPVKENSSPKARKQIDYKSIARNKYNEVPPSPRTLRPRLNLQAKRFDEIDEMSDSNECSSTNIQNKNQNKRESNSTSDNRMENNNNKKNEMSTLFGLREENINESKESTDTNKNLSEIKDLLQNFLTVINQNSTHGEKNTTINGLSDTSNYQANTTTNVNNNTVGNAFPQCNVPPVMPMFPTSCCYPIMPIYPVNYLQNGYLFPNVSNTCNSTAKTTKHPKRSSSTCDHKHSNSSSETHELLKEIHDFVTQNSVTDKKKEVKSKRRQHFITRSVGDSSIASNYNKHVKDTRRCISKSCEALGCGDSCNLYSNTSFSDTVLERFSIEATRSTTDFNPTFQTREIKINKLKDIFNPWKWGKKKNEALEEISEGEDLFEEDNINVRPPPFKQNITNYAMYRQEYYNPPPMKHQQQKIPKRSTPLIINDARNYSQYYPDHPNIHPHYHDNPQTHPYHRYQPEGPMPQVPLCLKEIEVKSAGTQSERKMSLFKKFTKKVKIESEPSEANKKPPAKTKSGIFNWKTVKESAKTGAIPKDFTLKTQQQLAQGDTKMKNALIKKLFYKRNPFSPRNLIVKTLLGNDPSSYGNPPKLIKPKYFL